MKYPAYGARGQIVGYGAIERGVRDVVSLRMKGVCMRCAVNIAENMIRLRAAYLGNFGTADECPVP